MREWVHTDGTVSYRDGGERRTPKNHSPGAPPLPEKDERDVAGDSARRPEGKGSANARERDPSHSSWPKRLLLGGAACA